MAALKEQFNIVDTLTQAAEQIWKEKKRAAALGEKSSNSEISEGHDILSILCTFLPSSRCVASGLSRLSEGKQQGSCGGPSTGRRARRTDQHVLMYAKFYLRDGLDLTNASSPSPSCRYE